MYSSRTNNETVNMGEALGSVAFGLYDRSTGRAVKPDPRFISFKMMVGSRNPDYTTFE